jgi:hypothetical protein
VPVSTPVYRFMRFYNARFAAIARKRRERRVWGSGNSRKHYLFQSFSISPKDLPRIVRAAAQWWLLELREGWRSWFDAGVTGKIGEPAAEATSAVRETAKAGSV